MIVVVVIGRPRRRRPPASCFDRLFTCYLPQCSYLPLLLTNKIERERKNRKTKEKWNDQFLFAEHDSTIISQKIYNNNNNDDIRLFPELFYVRLYKALLRLTI